MGGIELSTFFGHALALGAREWLDWRRLDGSEITMPELAQRVLDAGCLFVIAHVMHPGDPECCGCRWERYDMMPGNASAVEVWNGPWAAFNQESLLLFYRWLNEGHRLTATTGTDLHGPPPPDVRGAVNVVYAEDLTEAAVLAAIKAGRSYISAGPELLLNVQTESGREGMIGDTLPARGGDGHHHLARGAPGRLSTSEPRRPGLPRQDRGRRRARCAGRWQRGRHGGATSSSATPTAGCGPSRTRCSLVTYSGTGKRRASPVHVSPEDTGYVMRSRGLLTSSRPMWMR